MKFLVMYIKKDFLKIGIKKRTKNNILKEINSYTFVVFVMEKKFRTKIIIYIIFFVRIAV